MLTMTDAASTVVKEIVSRNGGTEEAGLRIESEAPTSTEYEVAIVPSPTEEDALVERDGARVYLGANAAQALGDKQLDATVSEDGRVSFDLAPQPA